MLCIDCASTALLPSCLLRLLHLLSVLLLFSLISEEVDKISFHEFTLTWYSKLCDVFYKTKCECINDDSGDNYCSDSGGGGNSDS